jgi:hypothetical protein
MDMYAFCMHVGGCRDGTEKVDRVVGSDWPTLGRANTKISFALVCDSQLPSNLNPTMTFARENNCYWPAEGYCDDQPLPAPWIDMLTVPPAMRSAASSASADGHVNRTQHVDGFDDNCDDQGNDEVDDTLAIDFGYSQVSAEVGGDEAMEDHSGSDIELGIDPNYAAQQHLHHLATAVRDVSAIERTDDDDDDDHQDDYGNDGDRDEISGSPNLTTFDDTEIKLRPGGDAGMGKSNTRASVSVLEEDDRALASLLASLKRIFDEMHAKLASSLSILQSTQGSNIDGRTDARPRELAVNTYKFIESSLALLNKIRVAADEKEQVGRRKGTTRGDRLQAEALAVMLLAVEQMLGQAALPVRVYWGQLWEMLTQCIAWAKVQRQKVCAAVATPLRLEYMHHDDENLGLLEPLIVVFHYVCTTLTFDVGHTWPRSALRRRKKCGCSNC